jgi:hypothetical protein
VGTAALGGAERSSAVLQPAKKERHRQKPMAMAILYLTTFEIMSIRLQSRSDS